MKNIQSCFKNIMPSLLLAVVIPLVEATFILFPILSPPGFVFYGDTSPILEPYNTLISSYSMLNFQSTMGPSSAFIWFPFFSLYTFISIFVGAEITSKVLVIIAAFLPATSMFVFANEFIGIMKKDHFAITKKGTLLIAFVASQVYELSFVNSSLTVPLNPWSFDYIALPLIIIGLLLYITEGKKIYLIIAGLATIISTLNPFWIEEFVLIFLPLIIFNIPRILRRIGTMGILLRMSSAVLYITIANAFWIVPLYVQYHIGIASYSLTNNPLSFGLLIFQSRGFYLEDILFFGHATYDLFGIWHQNWSLLNSIPTFFTYLPLFTRRRKSLTVMSLYVSLIIGLFLSKGANPPFGYLFYVIGNHLPFGFGEYFRNGGNIFLGVVMIPASVLIALGIYDTSAYILKYMSKLSNHLQNSSNSIHSANIISSTVSHNWMLILVVLILLSATSLPLAAGTYADQSVYRQGFTATPIPNYYYQTNGFLQSQKGHFNIMWIPSGATIIHPYWKPYIITNFPQSISYRGAIPYPNLSLEYLNVPNSNITENWLSLLGVRYVIVHSDMVGFPTNGIISHLESEGLTIARSFGNITILEVTHPLVPSRLYILPETSQYNSSFPLFNGDEYVNVSRFGENPVNQLHYASPYVPYFNGDGYMTLSHPINFSEGANFSISAWVNTQYSGTQVIAQDNVYGGTWNGWILGLSNGYPYFQAGQTSYTTNQGLYGNFTINDGQWHFIVGERNGTTWQLYVDGRLVASRDNMTSIPILTDQNMSIGGRITSYGDNTWFFQGSIADVQIYNSSLDSEQVAELASEGLSGYHLNSIADGWLLEQVENRSLTNFVQNEPSLRASNITWSDTTFLPDLDFGSMENFSISAWVNTQYSGTQVIAQDNVYGGTWNGWILGLSNGYPYFQAGQTSYTTNQGLYGNFTINDGQWHFIVGERNGTTWQLYVDGRLVASRDNMTSIPILTDQNMSIGGRITSYGDNTWFFQGSIADVQIYAKGLSNSSVEHIYEMGIETDTNYFLPSDTLLNIIPVIRNGSLTMVDYSSSNFTTKLTGNLTDFKTPLPLQVDYNGDLSEILSFQETGQTEWNALVKGHGLTELVLAEPYTPGWVAKYGSVAVDGEPLFQGMATVFKFNFNGTQLIQLNYIPEVALPVGTTITIVGLPGIPVLIAVFDSVKRKK
jgi:hypothetical protein